MFTELSPDFVEFWGLPPLILFFNMSTGWFGRFVLSTECYRTRKLGYNNLNWPRCSAWVTESLALTDGGFCQKQTLYDVYFDCEPSTQSYASLVFLGMHASRKVQSWQKVSHLLEWEYRAFTHIVLGKVSCVPETTLCELYGVKFWEGLA